MGVAYVLIASGLALILGALGLFTFAHGEFFMAGAFVLYVSMAMLGIPYLWVLPLAGVAVGLLGYICGRWIIYPMREKGLMAILLATFGVGIILQNAVLLIFGPHPKFIESPYTGKVIRVGSIRTTEQDLVCFLVGAGLIALLYLLLYKTTVGRCIRAVGDNRVGAAVVGIRLWWVYGLTWFLGCFLAGVAGAVIGPSMMAYPSMGSLVLFQAFVVLIVGGLGSIGGAVVVGLLLGVVNAVAIGFLPTMVAGTLGFGVAILMLLLRPSGLFGGYELSG